MSKSWLYIYMKFACLSVILNKINVKTAEPIGPKFCMGPYMTPRKVCRGTKLQKLVFKSFWFLLNLKNAQQILINLRTFVYYCFILYKEKIYTDRATVKSWKWRWVLGAFGGIFTELVRKKASLLYNWCCIMYYTLYKISKH